MHISIFKDLIELYKTNSFHKEGFEIAISYCVREFIKKDQSLSFLYINDQ